MLFSLPMDARDEDDGGRPLSRFATPALNCFLDGPSSGCMRGEMFSGSAMDTARQMLVKLIICQ